jgi:membrane protein
MDKVKVFIEIVQTTFKEWKKDSAPMLAAALAYYTAFSLAPLIVLVVAIAGLVVSQEE